MNILVLGATSVIGSEIAAAFSTGNRILLAGRDPGRLREAGTLCKEAGAEQITELPCDLSAGTEALARAAIDAGVNVIINAASATSRLTDDQIPPHRLADYLRIEISAPLELIRSLAGAPRDTPLRVLYISSILAVVRTPRRTVYSSLKAVHEAALSAMAASDHRVTAQIVRVATIIDADRHTKKARLLARAVRRAFDDQRPLVTLGLAGRLMAALYFTQPLVFRAAVRLVRVLRGSVRQ